MILANGEEIKLTYNLAALVDIENEFDGITDITEVLTNSKHILRDTLSLIRIGVNATIRRENELKGENRPLYTNAKLASLIDTNQLGDLRDLIASAFTDSNKQVFETEENSKNT